MSRYRNLVHAAARHVAPLQTRKDVAADVALILALLLDGEAHLRLNAAILVGEIDVGAPGGEVERLAQVFAETRAELVGAEAGQFRVVQRRPGQFADVQIVPRQSRRPLLVLRIYFPPRRRSSTRSRRNSQAPQEGIVERRIEPARVPRRHRGR